MSKSVKQLLEHENISDELKRKTEEILSTLLNKGKLSSSHINPSFVRMTTMLIKNDTYTAVGRIQDEFIKHSENKGSQPTTGYKFEGSDGKSYALRVEDGLLLVKFGNVDNLSINPNGNYFNGVDTDLRKLPLVTTVPGDIFTDEEMNKYMKWFRDMQMLMGNKPIE